MCFCCHSVRSILQFPSWFLWPANFWKVLISKYFEKSPVFFCYRPLILFFHGQKNTFIWFQFLSFSLCLILWDSMCSLRSDWFIVLFRSPLSSLISFLLVLPGVVRGHWLLQLWLCIYRFLLLVLSVFVLGILKL